MSKKALIETISNMEKTLSTLLSSSSGKNDMKSWSQEQHNIYKMIKSYVVLYEKVDKKYESLDDITIIRSNLSLLDWYKYSSSKPVLNIIFDSMKLLNYDYSNNHQSHNYVLELDFFNFSLNVSYYLNKNSECTNYYVYFENNKTNERAYLCFYSKMLKHTASKDLLDLQIPEFNKIYKVTGLDKDIYNQFEILALFSEIIFYYDETGTIGDVRMNHKVSATLNDIIKIYTKERKKKFNADIE